ncbi:MAG TPA: histidine kinase [Streptosporangiaceae bacterium]
MKFAWKMLARLVRRLGWGVALLPVSAMGMGMFGVRPWTVALPVCALLLVAWWPAVAARLLPVTMMAAGACGLIVAAASQFHWTILSSPGKVRYAIVPSLPPGSPAQAVVRRTWTTESYAVHPGTYHAPLPAGALVPLALLLLAVGLWLVPRMLAALRSDATRLLPYLRRWPQQGRWGVLLMAAVALGFLTFGMNVWTACAVPVALALVLGWPVIAADLVPPALAAFAGYGISIAVSWQSLASSAFQPGKSLTYLTVHISTPDRALLAGVEATALLAFSAWLVPRTVGAHARVLLGREPDTGLAGRVQQLTQTRADAVDSAAAELRRIERDLHDGAQARLVALGISLRAVEHMLPGSPDDALALVTEARHTSSRALSDLRDLVRGICPPVLADRGLESAVEALALDTPLPVQLDMNLPGRLTVPVESACYFAVAELLANAVRHSGARTVHVRVEHAAGMLRIEVADDGHGGADPARGSGLAGVERRLGTFDGILAVSSPPGGPTMIAIEVPCVLSSLKTYSC